MSQLSNQVKNFKKSLNANTGIGVKRTASAALQKAEQSGMAGSIMNNTKASFVNPHEPRKKSKKATVYSQPASTGSGHHTMSQFYTVMQFLKDNGSPQTVISITSRTKVDIVNNRALWEKLVHSDKIEFDQLHNTFAYKPAYQIKSKEDLLTLLTEKQNEGGMDYKDLKDSYSKLSEVVEELAETGEILVYRNKDGNPRALYYNNVNYNTPIDKEFKDMWQSIKIPDETDLPKALEDAGLKKMEVFEKKVVTEAKPKRSKTRNKKIKITNTHLSHIDLSKDYVPKK